jgi:hypothetical protein
VLTQDIDGYGYSISNVASVTGGQIGNATTYLYGDGSNITNVPIATEIAYGTSNVIVTGSGGNVAIGTNNSMIWNFDTAGNLTLPNGTSVVMPGYPGIGEASDAVSLVDTQAWLANPAGTTYVGFDGIAGVQLGINSNTVIFDATGNLTVSGNISAVGTITAPNLVAELPFLIKVNGFEALAGGRYGVDTTGGAVTATLPSAPATGAAILFADAGGAFATNNLTIDPNGGTIMDSGSSMAVSTDNQTVGLFYSGTTWRIYNAG